MSQEMRPYQRDAIEALRHALAAMCLRVLLYLPTGGGKGSVANELIRLARAKGKRVLFLVHRVELVRQQWRRLEQSGIYAGVIQGANTRGMDRDVIVASIQSVARRGCPEYDLLLIDEAHRVAASQDYLKLLSANPKKPVVGFTATPMTRGLGRHVADLDGPLFSMVKGSTIRELIDLGFLVDCDIYGPHEPDLSGVKMVAGDYHEGQLGAAVDKPALIGDIVTTWRRLANGKRTVCFATNVAHSQHIVEQFIAAGVPAEHVDAHTSDDDRDAIQARLLSGETLIVSNVGIYTEGWDMPAVEVMILARPTRSLGLYIQMAGRVLRVSESKQKALILDHSGTCRRLGFPTDDLPLELDDGSKKPEQKDAKPKERLPEPCPSCGYMLLRVRKCPSCGFEPKRSSTVESQAGDLVALKRAKQKGGKIAAASAAEKAQLFAELLGYAKARGFKDGWAAHKCKELWGTWPAKQDGVYPQAPSESTLQLIRHLNIKHARSKVKYEARA